MHDNLNHKHQCQLCPSKYHLLSELRYHGAMDHNMSFVCCTKCPKAFPTRASLKSHTKVHLVENVPCSLCQKFFKSIKHWKTHSFLVHGMEYP